MPRTRRTSRRSQNDQEKIEQEALERALQNKSEANYPAIIEGFKAKGIPVEEIHPRENVFTYNAWKRKGRQVMRGEHGVKIHTVIDVEKVVDPVTGEKDKFQKRKTASVFHIRQTKIRGDEDPAGHEPLPSSGPAATLPARERPTNGANIAERLREKAAGLQQKIDHLLRPMTQRHTAKRFSQYRNRIIEGNHLGRVQLVLEALATLHEESNCPADIAHLRHVNQIGPLVRRRCRQVPNGYHPYSLEDEGYYNDTPAGLLLQGILEGDIPAESEHERERHQQIEILETELRGQKIEGFFPTPRGLAERVVDMAEIGDEHEVLEPSAGIGSLAEVVRDKHPNAKLVCVEKNHSIARLLDLKEFEHHIADFMDVSGEVDRIVMNPPFERGQDIEHVRHAYTLLRPGGKLVAIMSAGPFFRHDRQSSEFREWLVRDVAMERYEQLEDQFNKSEAFRQTGVRIAVVSIEKGGN